MTVNKMGRLLAFEMVSNILPSTGQGKDLYKVPKNAKVIVEKNTVIKITSIDKELVGKIAAEIKLLKPVEPYKGKGIKEKNQYILRKEGKKKQLWQN